MRARGTISLVHLALFLFVLAALIGTGAASAEECHEPMLPGTGIAYPGGYDVNTVGSVRGTISEFQVPEVGPVRFLVDGEGERWVVLASPAWFWKMTDLHLAPGDMVTVQGSKTLGADGTLYLIAQEIRPQGARAAVFLRDHRGAPVWGNGAQGGKMPGGGRDGGVGVGAGIGRGHNGGGGRR